MNPILHSLRTPMIFGLSTFAILAAGAAPAAKKSTRPEPGAAEVGAAKHVWTFTPDPALPNVLILGDSISIGYTLDVRAQLQGRANVHRPLAANGRQPENCGDTRHGVSAIDRWLGDTKWAVIHFNWGLHDLKRISTEKGQKSDDPAVPPQNSIEDYTAHLETLVTRMKKTGAKLIFATTTPYPEGVKPCRVPADADRYNAAALAVMKKHGIAVDDLHAAVKSKLAELQLPLNVHFKAEGSKFLGERVAQSIRAALPSP